MEALRLLFFLNFFPYLDKNPSIPDFKALPFLWLLDKFQDRHKDQIKEKLQEFPLKLTGSKQM